MLKKGFLKRNTVIASKKRLIFSIILGLSTSFSIYVFLCFLQIIFRFFDSYFANWALILNHSEHYWENFYFALISLSIGNAIFLLNFFRKPDTKSIQGYKRLLIINNQRAVHFSFFYFFIKLFSVLGLSSGIFLQLKGVEYKLFFILSFIVLFFESWKAILLVFRKKIYKLLIMNLFCLLALAFLFPSISVFDNKGLDQVFIETNPKVDVPITKYSSFENSWPVYSIKLVKKGDEIVYNINRENKNLNELAEYLFHNPRRLNHDFNSRVYLYIPKNIEVKEVKKVEKLLDALNYFRVSYITVKPEKYEVNRLESRGVFKTLKYNHKVINDFLLKELNEQQIPLPPRADNFIEVDSIIEVKISEYYTFNGSIVSSKDLVEQFVKSIDSTTAFHYLYDDSITFQKYITLFSAHKQAIEDLKANDQKVALIRENFRHINKKEYEQDQSRLQEKYPLFYFENKDFTDYRKSRSN